VNDPGSIGTITIQRTSLTRAAYHALRSSILIRNLAPGSKLSVRPLCESLGRSPTPIKGALAALEREGLVSSATNRGYFVPTFGVADVPEIHELRDALESISARLAAKIGDPALVRRLKRMLREQLSCVRSEDLEHYGDLDLEFHRILWEASGNWRLIQAAETLAGQLRLLISTSARATGRLDRSLEEHGAIIDAIEAGKPAQAARAMSRHVQHAGEALSQYLDQTSHVDL
jgi:DNA-binding GntR family transcriptional regulator